MHTSNEPALGASPQMRGDSRTRADEEGRRIQEELKKEAEDARRELETRERDLQRVLEERSKEREEVRKVLGGAKRAEKKLKELVLLKENYESEIAGLMKEVERLREE